MLGINVSAERAHGWVGPGMGSAIFSIAVLLVLTGSIATFGILAAMNVWGGTDVSQPSAPIAPSPAPPPVTPVAPAPAEPPTETVKPPAEKNHIIPDVKEATREPKVHNYTFNVLEFKLAINFERAQKQGVDLERSLKMLGYDISKEKIESFAKQHEIKPGDTVLVKGKVARYQYVVLRKERIIVLAGPVHSLFGDLNAHLKDPENPAPQWLSEMVEKLDAKEEVIITLRGTVRGDGTIRNCELVALD